MDPEEVRRLETLIPGTDQETEEDLRYVRRPRRQEPPPPDLPQELARTYGKGLKGLRVRSLLVFLLAAAALVPCLLPRSLSPSPRSWRWDIPSSSGSPPGFWGAGMLLSLDVLAAGLWRGLRLKVGMDTLAALSCAFTLADTLLLAGSQDRGGQLSYCPAALFGLFFLLHGTYHKRCALRLSCRTAAAAAEPYLVTLDEGKWNRKDTYAKWSGTPRRLWQPDPDGRRRPAHLPGVLSRPAAGLHSLFPAGLLRHRGGEHLMWCLSATFTAAAGFGGALAYGRSFHKVARRVSQSGGALAGWPGAAGSRQGQPGPHHRSGPVPPGFVELNGIKVFGDFSVERVVGYTATLIRDSGCGLEKLFHDLLRTQGAIFRRADSLCCYEGGGLSANIQGDQVLVGSAAFMNLMEVPLPQGLNVKNAVFCAIDGELAGIFALNYTLPDTVFPSLTSPASGAGWAGAGHPRLQSHPGHAPAAVQAGGRPDGLSSGGTPAGAVRSGAGPHRRAHRRALSRGAAPLRRVGGGGPPPAPGRPGLRGAHLRRLHPGGSAGLLPDLCGRLRLPLPLNLLFYLLMWLLPVWFLSGWVHRY